MNDPNRSNQTSATQDALIKLKDHLREMLCMRRSIWVLWAIWGDQSLPVIIKIIDLVGEEKIQFTLIFYLTQNF